jgi:hypothetical protein
MRMTLKGSIYSVDLSSAPVVFLRIAAGVHSTALSRYGDDDCGKDDDVSQLY